MDQRLLRRVRRWDHIARWGIASGGILIIAAVAGIFVLIASVSAPLFFAPQAEQLASFPIPLPSPSAKVLAVGTDEYLESGFAITSDGTIAFFDMTSGVLLDRTRLAAPDGAPGPLREAREFGRSTFGLWWEGGAASVVKISFAPSFDEQGRRTIVHAVEEVGTAIAPPAGGPPRRLEARFHEDSGTTRVALLPGDRLAVTWAVVNAGPLGGGEPEFFDAMLEAELPAPVTALAMSNDGGTLYAGTAEGHLAWWDLRDPGAPVLQGMTAALARGRAVTALAFVLGDNTVAVGDAASGLTTWFPAPPRVGERPRLIKSHTLQAHADAVARIRKSAANRGLVTLGADGTIHLQHTTNERMLLRLRGERPFTDFAVSTRYNGVVAVDGLARLTVWALDIPHPEAGWAGAFKKLLYDGYPAPAFVWQSSAGEDTFEPKLSLVPLIFGTIKGTLYGMAFAAPLAVLGAMYTAHLMRPEFRRVVKPTLEVMGSVPTVVVGFLAALWLAPLLRLSLPGVFIFVGLFPIVLFLTVMGWERIKRRLPGKDAVRGYEFVVLFPVVAAVVLACGWLGGVVEESVLGNTLDGWLFERLGVKVDQRNSLVIAFALGFAVIPPIFTIAEDALSNVPRSLTAASLALGASRWQTVWRVVLPSASAGVFAALMIGFGRAVGETMIVLMATGNTPIMDISPFNGMRTLAANIAVEIPEAPFNGTLYRTLFLSALVLFLMTFILNSAAEIIRQRLRNKYGRY